MSNRIFDMTVGEIFGVSASDCDGDYEGIFYPGFLYSCGQSWFNMLRNLFVPGAAFSAVGMKMSEETCAAECDCSKVCKPSQLPIYKDTSCCNCDACPKGEALCPPQLGFIENGFRSVRLSLSEALQKFQTKKVMLEVKCSDATEKAKSAIVFLREEQNSTHRAGAIALGGVTGLILGARGGIFKKLVFMSLGAAGMAAICYPTEAEEYSKQALVEAMRYGNIGYNFIYGVKPGDEPLLPKLPKIPTTMSEVWGTVTSAAISAKNAVLPGSDKVKDEAEKKHLQSNPADKHM